ncbi:MAG: GreA/GreB family elongation factor [Deltaproteobacteria bacterium]|nr:GreA/GreB family elongation factor [Myxococcales bacterium]MDP3216421.1 GreA/GreB family elongation factor [Deltaproteobacteria bacterium]
MSKAFTKEDDTADDAPVVPLPTLGPVVRLTRDAVTLLRAEAARTDDPARRRLLAEAVDRATVVPEGIPDRVRLGARVTVESDAEGRREELLVSPEEFELTGRGWSVASPVGRALFGAEPGDEVEVVRPRGRITLRVVAVRM